MLGKKDGPRFCLQIKRNGWENFEAFRISKIAKWSNDKPMRRQLSYDPFVPRLWEFLRKHIRSRPLTIFTTKNYTLDV